MAQDLEKIAKSKESEPVEESVTEGSSTDVLYKKREEESIKQIIWYNNF